MNNIFRVHSDCFSVFGHLGCVLGNMRHGDLIPVWEHRSHLVLSHSPWQLWWIVLLRLLVHLGQLLILLSSACSCTL